MFPPVCVDNFHPYTDPWNPISAARITVIFLLLRIQQPAPYKTSNNFNNFSLTALFIRFLLHLPHKSWNLLFEFILILAHCL